MCEATVHKYPETVSAVLEDAKRNDILLYNPAHRVRGIRVEKKVQRVPAEFEMRKLMQCILQEPLLYRVFYLTAITTGMRRRRTVCPALERSSRWRGCDGTAFPQFSAGTGNCGKQHQKPPCPHCGYSGTGA